jgi:hypothetical protein
MNGEFLRGGIVEELKRLMKRSWPAPEVLSDADGQVQEVRTSGNERLSPYIPYIGSNYGAPNMPRIVMYCESQSLNHAAQCHVDKIGACEELGIDRCNEYYEKKGKVGVGPYDDGYGRVICAIAYAAWCSINGAKPSCRNIDEIVAVTNAVKFSFIDHRNGKNATPPTKAFQYCEKHILPEELSALAPDILIAMGRTSQRALRNVVDAQMSSSKLFFVPVPHSSPPNLSRYRWAQKLLSQTKGLIGEAAEVPILKEGAVSFLTNAITPPIPWDLKVKGGDPEFLASNWLYLADCAQRLKLAIA